ncbi:MAG TPA: hypothetical protein VK184_18735 [Nostocaceae cyanobacterium]|nr:hypothetical protein [Nostocaceae cyanobacterium]
MKNLIKASIAIAISTFTWNCFTPKAEAFKLHITDNNVTMIEDLEIDNNLYDVHFVYGSPEELYNPANPYSKMAFFSYPQNHQPSFPQLRAIVAALNTADPIPLAGGYPYFSIPLSPELDFTIGVAGAGIPFGIWELGYREEYNQAWPLLYNQPIRFAVFMPAQQEVESVPEPQGIIGLLVAAGLSVTAIGKVRKTTAKQLIGCCASRNLIN